MNARQQPAVKPQYWKADVLDTKSSPVSPALSGATNAFLPRQNPLTRTQSAQPALTSSPGARFAARAVCATPEALSPPTITSPYTNTGSSPERGRSLHLKESKGHCVANDAVSPQDTLSLARPILIRRSPSAIAAIHAASQASSPARSPNRSPHRRTNTIASQQTSQILPPDLSNALAGAVKSMVTARKDEPIVPARNWMLNFAKILPLSGAPTKSELDVALHERSSMKPTARPSILIPQSTLSVPPPTRDRAQSVGDEKLLLRNISRGPPASTELTLLDQPSGDLPFLSSSNPQRPPIPFRRLHQAPNKTSVGQTHGVQDHRGMTINSLADAMVASSIASSLASSRATSPAKRPHTLNHRRRSRSFSALYDLSAKHDAELTRKPLNQPRQMKHTLRKQSVTEDEDVELIKRGRRHWMRKHPNKHHEGDRKRWRDKVTERERKRYEGLFAANRGLLIGSGAFKPSAVALADNNDESNKVVNVIVREIWERSRLPREILMEVYDLVASERDKSLNREQFVVGMWLVDQRLKGRKLPAKVSTSVWSSVRHPDGIKLRGHGP